MANNGILGVIVIHDNGAIGMIMSSNRTLVGSCLATPKMIEVVEIPANTGTVFTQFYPFQHLLEGYNIYIYTDICTHTHIFLSVCHTYQNLNG